MVNVDPPFKPRKISDGEFRRSNVFVACSGKAGHDVQLIGPSQYDAWLIIEFGPDVVWLCERPPIYIELLPLEGKRRPLDFWVRQRSGKQFGVTLHDEALALKRGCTLDLLKRSIEASKLNCEIWQATDLRSRRTYVRNLKQLQPFTAMGQPSDEQLATALMAHLHKVKAATWSELTMRFASRFDGVVNAEIARLIHQGRAKANLGDHALASNTLLSPT